MSVYDPKSGPYPGNSSKGVAVRERALYVSALITLIPIGITTYFASTTDLFGWELDITRWMQEFSLGPARFLRGWIFWLGVKGAAGGVALMVLGLLWLKHRRLEAIFLILIGIPDLWNLWLREILARPRPTDSLVEVIGGPQGFSFPSGTTLHTLLFYGILLYLANRYISSRRHVYTLGTLTALYVCASGIWVVYDGRHWFLDAMGGYLYGAFYLLLLIASLNWIEGWLGEKRTLEFPGIRPRFLRKPVENVLRLVSVK